MRALIAATFLLGITGLVSAQDAPSAKRWTEDDRNHRVNLYPHLGSVVLPDGFEGAVTSNWMDAWGGFLKSKTTAFKIVWTAGLIESPFEKSDIGFSWSEPEQVGDVSVVLGKAKSKDVSILVAKVGKYPVHFGAEINSDSDREAFLKIVRSYTNERCPICKSLRFIGELRSSN